MRPGVSISYVAVAALAAFRTSASSSNAHVFLLGPQGIESPRTTHHEMIDPVTARSLFAERLSLSQFYDIPNVDEVTLQLLNRYGGASSQLLLRDTEGDESSRIFIVVDGVENAIDLVPSRDGISFLDINPAPHPAQTTRLLQDMISNAESVVKSPFVQARVENVLQQLSELGGNILTRVGQRYILHIRSLSDVAKAKGTSTSQYKDHQATIHKSFNTLADLVTTEQLIATIMLTPPESRCSKASDDVFRLKSLKTRQTSEELLAGSVTSASHYDALSTQPSLPADPSSSLLSGPVPTCFSSKSACESGTNNCTGHGECLLKFTEKRGERESECYGCMCSKPEVRTNRGGSKKTTYFGGGACQKKDVATPFWLLTGVTVFIVFLISWGVGLLYSIGNEELPSVIGAGVSGPRAK